MTGRHDTDITSEIDDAEHPAFLCPLCDSAMETHDDVEIASAYNYQCLVHRICADELREIESDQP